MENSIENKQKFFAIYYGQRVLIRNPKNEEYDDKIINSQYNLSGWETAAILELKSIENVSNEDILEWMNYQDIFRKEPDNFIKRFRFSYNNETSFSSDFADFFRSKGYAIPYLKLSIQNLIDLGWVVLE